MVCPDGSTLAAAHPLGLSLWDTRTGKLKAQLDFAKDPEEDHGGVNPLSLSGDGHIVVFHDGHGRYLRLWDSTTAQPPETLRSIASNPVIASDGSLLVLYRLLDDESRMWDLNTGQPRKSRLVDSGKLHMMALEGGRFLGYELPPPPDRRTIWDLTTERKLLTLPHAETIICSYDGKRCVSSHAGVMQVWDLTSVL